MQKESTAYLVQSKWMIRKATTLSWLWLVVSTCSPDPTQAVSDQTQTHPRPSQSIYSISKPICSIPKPWAALTLLSKHFCSGEHHFWTHLTIPDELKTSWIPSTNQELACSPLNSKTQYAQPWLGKAQMLSNILIESHSFSLILIIICSSLPLSCFLLSLLSSVNPVSI